MRPAYALAVGGRACNLARVSGTLTRCRSCGRDTATTEDWRCAYCGQPKPVTAEPIDVEEPEARDELTASYRGPGVWEDLAPQILATSLAALIAVIGFLLGSELLLIAAAAVLVVAVVAKIVADGW
jgi:hypothetical protein